MTSKYITVLIILCSAGSAGAVDFVRTKANDGNLVLENVPRVPVELINDLNQFQNVRAAAVLDWSADGKSLFINTRFSDVSQIHEVNHAGGARRQLTFFHEPIGAVSRRPGSPKLIYSRDANGGEFAQLFMLDPANGSSMMLTDGFSRNSSASWDRSGRNLAYTSTRRNGASNDIWTMNPDEPASAEIAVESTDGSFWRAQDFSSSGSKILVQNYLSITNSSIHLVDLDAGDRVKLIGDAVQVSSNQPIGFDADNEGFWFISDLGSEFNRLAWQPLASDAAVTFISTDIPWDITNAALSHDRQRMAFIANEDGYAQVYLLDTRTHEYKPVSSIPAGMAFGLNFSPDDTRLALSLNNARTPSDVYVLDLGASPMAYNKLTRWTTSEVGGLDTSTFTAPELIHFPTFDRDQGKRRMIPAWLYKPAGAGPFPVIISIHGGPEGQSRPYFSSTYQMWLKKLGVAVLVPNVRGSKGYGKTYLSLDNGNKREGAVRDIGALLDYIEDNDSLNEDRVAVYGGSYGGYMSLASAVQYSKRLRAAVDVVGISNFVSFLENTQDYRRDLRRAEYGDERDPQMRRFLEDISPLNNVKRIKVPLFVVQGQNDPRVPVTESEQMVAALRRQGRPVWYMNALNEGHGYKKKENRDIYQQAMVLFFRQYLLGVEIE